MVDQTLTREQIAALRRGAAVSYWDQQQGERYAVKLMLCVNDPDNGSFRGRVRAVEVIDWKVADVHIGLECRFLDWEPACQIRSEGKLQLSRRRFDILQHRTWVGNWCWDQVIVTAWTAAQIFNWLRLQGYWTMDVAECSMWDKWQRAEPFKWSDFAVPGVRRWMRDSTST